MDTIYNELRENGITITKATLMYYINNVYNKYTEVYKDISSRLSCDQLLEVWEKMNSTKFGHVIAYLTLVYCSNITEERRRVAVHMTIPLLKSLDMSKYIIQERSDRDRLFTNYHWIIYEFVKCVCNL